MTGRLSSARLAAIAVIAGAGTLAVYEASLVLPVMHLAPVADFGMYLEATRRWFAGAPFYPASQLAGPYIVEPGAVLYPPTALLLFAPFLVLPAFLWWAIPIAIITWTVVHHRPTLAGWAVIALCMAYPYTWWGIATGNPGLWVMASLSLGTIWGWPAVGVLLKPSLFPLALLGIRRRSWWLALALGLALSLPFLAMFPDWIASMMNARGPRSGLFYSALDVPTLIIPLVAWWFRSADDEGVGMAHPAAGRHVVARDLEA